MSEDIHQQQQCLCYTCIIKEQNPYVARGKLSHVAQNINTWDVKKRDDWIFEFFHRIVAERAQVLETNKFNPLVEFIFEKGFSAQLLEMICKCYSLYIPNEAPKILDYEKLPPSDSTSGIMACMIFNEFMTIPNNSTKDLVLKHLMSGQAITIMYRAARFGSTLLKIAATKNLEWFVSDQNIINNVIGDDYITWANILQVCIYILQLPADHMLNESNVEKGNSQRKVLSHVGASEEQYNRYCLHHLQLLYQNASVLIHCIILENPDLQYMFAVEPNLFDTIIGQLDILPSHTCATSHRLDELAFSLALLCRVPFQLEDKSNDFVTLLSDMCGAADRPIDRLLMTYRKYVFDVNAVSYASQVVKDSVSYVPTQELRPDAEQIVSTKIVHTEMMLLTALCDLSYVDHVSRYIATNHVWFLDLLEKFLGLNNNNISHWMADQREKLKAGTHCVLFTQSRNKFSSQPEIVCMTKDMIGNCIVLLRNVVKHINNGSNVLLNSKEYVDLITASATYQKNIGVNVLKEKRNYKEALAHFSMGLHILPRPGDVDYPLVLHIAGMRDLKVTLLSNRAEMYLQCQDGKSAKIDLDAALLLDPNHEKSKRRLERVK
ncbi:hypothetical protein AKO1_006363 [Acrasis kona]|uniref:Uncharacterized protein n=1 Tax=Acrasis kona TaxID=1008807 RepID=A0AAW2YIC7_9EUKA